MISFDTPPDNPNDPPTPTQLGITEAEHRWLRQAAQTLRTMLPGELIAIPGDGRFTFDMRFITRQLVDDFNPTTSEGPIPGTYTCGTAGCIAGLMHILSWAAGAPLWQDTGDIDPGAFDEAGNWRVSQALHPLFWPFIPSYRYRQITPAIAADTIDRFLSTGEIHFIIPGS